MKQQDIKINFYGAFRKYGDYETLSLPIGSNIDDLKNALAKHLADKIQNFSDSQLIRDSAIACNDTVVGMQYKLQPGEVVSVLPPVCGG